MIIGGAEDRAGSKAVLARILDLAGGPGSSVAVITTASSVTGHMEEVYTRAFSDLGAAKVVPLHIDSRQVANDPANVSTVYDADIVFMTGGSQARLASILGGSEVAKAMHRARRDHGTVIAGTSAGASAISEHMLRDGEPHCLARKDMTNLIPGLGLLRRVVIDQHFTQRNRLGRLLSIVAENPFILGIGIDEDTAIVVDADTTMEVIGNHTVTIVDGRQMQSNVLDVAPGSLLAMTDIRLHVLPAGQRFHIETRTPVAEATSADRVQIPREVPAAEA